MSVKDANFPKDANGCTYHVGTKQGQVANRILTVGDPIRARLIGELLQDKQEYSSKRGFVTITGLYNSVPVSIIAIGMGFSMMDMMIREVRAVTQGPLLMLRFGSCGGIGEAAEVGSIAIADGGVMVSRNYDYFTDGIGKPYTISKPISGYDALNSALETNLNGIATCIKGVNATADSFYSSQGRKDPSFIDENQGLVDQLVSCGCVTIEMESAMLLHLAKCCNSERGPIFASACAMIFANRKTGEFIDSAATEKLVKDARQPILNALVSTAFPL